MPVEGLTQPREVVEEFVDALSRADLAALTATLSDDIVWEVKAAEMLPSTSRFVGKEALVSDMFGTAMSVFDPSSFSLDVTNTITAGDSVVVEWVAKAKTAKGGTYENSYCLIFTVADGLVTRVHEYLDTGYAKRVLFS